MRNPEHQNRGIDLPPNNFLKPDRGRLPQDKDIPLFGPGIRAMVDAVRSNPLFPTINPLEGEPRTLDEVSHVVRLRYKGTTAKVDASYQKALEAVQKNPYDDSLLPGLKRTIALTGAFNYVRGMQILRKDDPDQEVPHDNKGIPTANVSRDTDIVPNSTLSPSALYQLQKQTEISPDDDVLYLCSGAGGGVFFTAAAMPETLHAVDLYTPKYYDLDGTFALAREEVYAKVPTRLTPEITQPKFIQADASRLPEFDSANAESAGFQKEGYNKILLHPPYGRESMLAEDLQGITEADGFTLWIKSILAANKANTRAAQLFSIVPPEWGRALDTLTQGAPIGQALSTLYEELENLPYYQGTNAAKLRQLSNSVETEALNERRSEIEAIFSDETYSRKDLEEMGMFPLQINVLHLPGKSQSKVS